MRLIRNKVYRAFPELDRFSDEQCRRFVVAANSSWVRRIGRWIVVGGVSLAILCVMLGGVSALGDYLEPSAALRSEMWMLVLGVLLIAGSGVAFVGGLVLRDGILRRRVRQLIERCGACPACGYSLLGMRVGETFRIICPECGRGMNVDPAMGELETDETGAPVYRPRVAQDDAQTVAFRRARHRRFFKRGAIGVVGMIVVLAGAYGAWWWWLAAQAKTATAERHTRARVTALREAMWTRGPEEGSESEFCRFVELVQQVRDHQAGKDKLPQYGSPQGRFLGITWDVLLPENDAARFEKRNAVGTYEPTKRLVLDVLMECRVDGTTERLREILAMRAPMRELETDWKAPFFLVPLPDLGMARAMARLNAARMVQALYAQDRREYVDALEESLAAAQILERQGLLIEQLVSYAIRALMMNRVFEDHEKYPDDEWTREVLGAVVRRSEISGMWRSMQVEKEGGLDAVQCFFAKPLHVQKAQLGLGTSDMFGGGTQFGGWCGGYQGNKAAVAGFYDSWIAILKQDSWKRTGPLPQVKTGYVVVDELIPTISRASTLEFNAIAERNRCVATLAVDRHRWATGSSPTSVYQVWPYVSKPELLIDPGCGRPYRFGFVQEEGHAAPVFEVMLGDDDRPAKPPEPAKPKPAARPSPNAGPTRSVPPKGR